MFAQTSCASFVRPSYMHAMIPVTCKSGFSRRRTTRIVSISFVHPLQRENSVCSE